MLGCQLPEVAREVVEDSMKEVEGMAEKVEYIEEVEAADSEEVEVAEKMEKLSKAGEGGELGRILELQSVNTMMSSALDTKGRVLELQSSPLDTHCILTLATVDLETVTDDILTENFSDQVTRIQPLSPLQACILNLSPCLPPSPNSCLLFYLLV